MYQYSQHRSWMKSRKAIVTMVALFATISFGYIFTGMAPAEARFSGSDRRITPRQAAANSTLGFEKFLAVSLRPSWRTRGLEAAAKLTGLDISIPPQPFIHDDLVTAFENIGSTKEGLKRPSHGSARAWLAHLDMIKFVVASDLTSALIIEDDVDWDVTIREQMKLVSDNVRNFTRTIASDPDPYGNAWDILWIGHCGEVTKPETVKLEYPDPSLPATELYAGWTKKWLVNIAEGQRAVQKTQQTICTFGYGVSRAGAQNILNLMGRGQHEAFDVGMMTECQHERLRCISINPELMHHYNPKDGTGYVSPNNEANGNAHSAEDALFEHLKGTTANMKNSARCAALFNDVCPQPPTRAEDY